MQKIPELVRRPLAWYSQCLICKKFWCCIVPKVAIMLNGTPHWQNQRGHHTERFWKILPNSLIIRLWLRHWIWNSSHDFSSKFWDLHLLKSAQDTSWISMMVSKVPPIPCPSTSTPARKCPWTGSRTGCYGGGTDERDRKELGVAANANTLCYIAT